MREYGQKYSMRCYVGYLLEMWSEIKLKEMV